MTRPAASRRLRRARGWLIVAGLALLLGLGALLARALEVARSEQLMRREALAARVFDELEGSLAALIAGEEARPFVQWRRYWVPSSAPSKKGGKASEPELTRSPLSRLPERSFVLGYFQIEPDGGFATPLAPPEDDGDADPPVRERVELLARLNDDLGSTPAAADSVAPANADLPEPVQQQAVPQQAQQQALPEDVQIQRALDQQAIARQRKNAAPQEAFDPDAEQLANFLGADLGNGGVGLAGSGDALDVRVTPFTGELVDGGRLRLIRSVSIGERRWIQGLILDRAGLQAWLEDELLGAGELGGYLDLRWDPEDLAAAPKQGAWAHRFAPPFSQLSVRAELGPVELLELPAARLILGLGLALALAVIAVLIAVERSLASLLRRAEERERFIAAVTHELRTPLTSIRMYSEMLEQGMVEDAERRRGYHGTIRREAERLSRLVEQVLTLARLEDRRTEQVALADDPRAPLREIVDEVLTLLRPQAQARGLELRVELEPDVGERDLPRDALTQILTNLVDNAIKFTPAGGEAVELCGRAAAGELIIEIRDRGPGVEAEILTEIFEPFVRATREHADAVRGTGIGLALVRGLVEELGGRVSGQNRDQGGFCVRVELPA